MAVACAHVSEAYGMPAAPRWHPPTRRPLDGGLPGWIADDAFVLRVASDPRHDIGGMESWLEVRTADHLPTPMRRTYVVGIARARCLAPFTVLSPSHPFLAALRLDAEVRGGLYSAPAHGGSLAPVVHRLTELPATYTAAAGVLRHLAESDDDTPPPGGAA